MKLIRLALVILALVLGLAARNAPAQSVQQILTFSITAEYEYSTNVLLDADTLTNTYSSHRTLLVGSHNIVKAIAVDLFGTAWTNWAAAYIVRRLNPTNGTEGMFLTVGEFPTNISSFFGTTYLDDFTHDASNAFPGLTNNFSPQRLGHQHHEPGGCAVPFSQHHQSQIQPHRRQPLRVEQRPGLQRHQHHRP